MVLRLAAKILGSSNDRALKKYRGRIGAINDLESQYESLSDSELQNQTNIFRERLENGAPLDTLAHESFAVVREAAKRNSFPRGIMMSSL